jgi:hypothetical protein
MQMTPYPYIRGETLKHKFDVLDLVQDRKTFALHLVSKVSDDNKKVKFADFTKWHKAKRYRLICSIKGPQGYPGPTGPQGIQGPAAARNPLDVKECK